MTIDMTDVVIADGMSRLRLGALAARLGTARAPAYYSQAYRTYASTGASHKPSAEDEQPTIHLAPPDPHPPHHNEALGASASSSVAEGSSTPCTHTSKASIPLPPSSPTAPEASLPASSSSSFYLTPSPSPFPANTLGSTLPSPTKRLYPSTPCPPPASPESPLEIYRTRLQAQLRALQNHPEISNLSNRAQQAVAKAIADIAKNLTLVGLKLNEVTGYHEVERLKASVAAQEAVLSSARESANVAKQKYDEAVSSRSTAQRDVNALLERKHSWTDADVLAFTTLVRQDHASTLAVTNTSAQLKEAEAHVDKAFSQLTNSILQRYHEEQVWSDKIRSVATWANVGGLLFNFIIFIGAISFVEPWKRKRLVERMEERMNGLIARVESQIEGVGHRLDTVAGAASGAAGAGVGDAGVSDMAGLESLTVAPGVEMVVPESEMVQAQTVPTSPTRETTAVEKVAEEQHPPPPVDWQPTQSEPALPPYPQSHLSREYLSYITARTAHALNSYKWLGDDNQVITGLLGAVGGAVICAAVSLASSR